MEHTIHALTRASNRLMGHMCSNRHSVMPWEQCVPA